MKMVNVAILVLLFSVTGVSSLEAKETYIGTFDVDKVVWIMDNSIPGQAPTVTTTFFLRGGTNISYYGAAEMPGLVVDLFMGDNGQLIMKPHQETLPEKLGNEQ